MSSLVVPLLFLTSLFGSCIGILFVQRNEYRTYDELNGLWTFVREPSNSLGIGIQQKWYNRDIRTFANATVVPVPSAFNELFADESSREHIGWVWYQRIVYTHATDANYRTYLRFGSVQYYAIVYVNGQQVGDHTGGHLPFEFEVTSALQPGTANRITVAVNNTLSYWTLPHADFTYPSQSAEGVDHYPPGFFISTLAFGFFNYAGILRPVYIVKKPKINIDDIVITAAADGSFTYNVKTSGQGDQIGIRARIYRGSKQIYATKGTSGAAKLTGIKNWWPRGMGDPNLYTFQVEIAQQHKIIDIYRLDFGFRTLSWDQNKIYINSKPFYCIGFGMHEDADIRGRGFDPVIMTKDLNLLEWMGANCYRTSHYPYSEERQFESDRRGIAVITECPAVSLTHFPPEILALHKQFVQEMIQRDRNHPSTIAWSLANEPSTSLNASRDYFRQVVQLTKSLDTTRPAMLVTSQQYNSDKAVSMADGENTFKADLFDVLGINRYYGWYTDIGHLSIVNQSYIYEMTLWKKHFKVPLLVSEYGAEAMISISNEPGMDYTVQYQDQLIKNAHDGFDKLRQQNIIAGELIWNFADFMMAQDYRNPYGNHKGMFTRQRQPKMAAYTLRNRYKSLLDQH